MSHKKQLCKVEAQYLRSILQAKIMEIYIIGMRNQKKSIGRENRLGRKVNKSGEPHDTHNHGSIQTKLTKDKFNYRYKMYKCLKKLL